MILGHPVLDAVKATPAKSTTKPTKSPVEKNVNNQGGYLHTDGKIYRNGVDNGGNPAPWRRYG